MDPEDLKDKKSLVYRAIAIIVSSVFFANIPLLLFLIYMGHHGFFSYDFFAEGVFGLKVFFFLTALFFLFASLAFFGWLIPVVEWWKKREFKLGKLIVVLIVNSVFWLALVAAFPEDGEIFNLAYILGIGLFLSVHIAFLFHAKPIDQLRSLFAVIFVTVSFSILLRDQVASNLANSLRVYGVGGGIEVILLPKALEKDCIQGKLVLLSPSHIYVEIDGSKSVSVIDRMRFDLITIKHNKKLNKDAAETAAPVS